MHSSLARVGVVAALVITCLADSLLAVDDTDPSIIYGPANEWSLFSGASAAQLGAYNATFHFTSLSGNLSSPDSGVAQAYCAWNFTEPATAFAWYGFQRSDAGLYSICFDCVDGADGTTPFNATVDAYNKTSTGSDPPVILYSTTVAFGYHTVVITNMLDPRSGTYGQITLDAFGLVVPDNSSSSSSSSSSTSTSSSSTSSTSSSTSTTTTTAHSYPSPSPSSTTHSITASNLPSSPSTTPSSAALASYVPASGVLGAVFAALLALL